MQWIGFHLNNNEYSIPILKVREIIKTPAITRMPESPVYMVGVTNLRGSIVPIVDLKKLMGFNGHGEIGNNVIVLSSGKIIFGVLVDGITGVINVEESMIEPSDRFLAENVDQVEGVAKLSDRLVVLLNSKKLIPLEDVGLLEDYTVDVSEKDGDQVEVVRTVQTMGGEVKVKEVHDAKAFFEQRGIDPHDPRYIIFDDIIDFIEAMARDDYEKADNAVKNIVKKGRSGLFSEVGKITRKLHDSLRSFKDAIDPRFRDMASVDMPNAIDKLQCVIQKTEEAANKTLGIVEKYILIMDEVSLHIKNLEGPEGSVGYLRNFKNGLEDDLTEVLTVQSFQDITGQILRKVINLVGDIEEELVKLIANFGIKIEQGVGAQAALPEKVSQTDVDDLLKDFGF